MRGATGPGLVCPQGGDISTNAPLAGGDPRADFRWTLSAGFQPTPPLRGATGHPLKSPPLLIGFQPTPPLRGATVWGDGLRNPVSISTNAPLAGGDCSLWNNQFYSGISTNAPLAGGRQIPPPQRDCAGQFQPTPPLRGATLHSHASENSISISTNAPLAGGDPCRGLPALHRLISTNAPLAGGDRDSWDCCSALPYFNQRPPCGGRLRRQGLFQIRHADFNQRPPCGGRRGKGWRKPQNTYFNQRPPCGGRRRTPGKSW